MRAVPVADPLADLEQRALSACIRSVADAEVRRVLTDQLKGASVVTRTRTGIGFYADLAVDAGAMRLEGDAINVSPPSATGVHPDVPGAIFFVLYIKDGVMDVLEGASTEEWPAVEDDIQLQSWPPT